jgi:hypothetical protein
MLKIGAEILTLFARRKSNLFPTVTPKLQSSSETIKALVFTEAIGMLLPSILRRLHKRAPNFHQLLPMLLRLL